MRKFKPRLIPWKELDSVINLSRKNRRERERERERDRERERERERERM